MPLRDALGRFGSFLVEPLVDIPDLPGGRVGDVVERSIEDFSSPLSLALLAAAPVTGGGSLAARGGLAAGRGLGRGRLLRGLLRSAPDDELSRAVVFRQNLGRDLAGTLGAHTAEEAATEAGAPGPVRLLAALGGGLGATTALASPRVAERIGRQFRSPLDILIAKQPVPEPDPELLETIRRIPITREGDQVLTGTRLDEAVEDILRSQGERPPASLSVRRRLGQIGEAGSPQAQARREAAARRVEARRAERTFRQQAQERAEREVAKRGVRTIEDVLNENTPVRVLRDFGETRDLRPNELAQVNRQLRTNVEIAPASEVAVTGKFMSGPNGEEFLVADVVSAEGFNFANIIPLTRLPGGSVRPSGSVRRLTLGGEFDRPVGEGFAPLVLPRADRRAALEGALFIAENDPANPVASTLQRVAPQLDRELRSIFER